MNIEWIRQLRRFIASGLGVTATHIVVATLVFHNVAQSQPIANGVAFSFSTLFSYVINSLWSFSVPLRRQTLFRFLVVSLAGLCLTVSISFVAESLQYGYWSGVLGIVITVPALTFLLHKTWTYKCSSS